MSANDCSTVLRRFAGAAADEVAILCRPEDSSPNAAQQADAAYRALADALAAEQATTRDLATETLFLRDIRRDLGPVLESRARVLGESGQADTAPPPHFIQQAPIDTGASFELTASAVVPRDRATWSARDLRPTLSCPCEGCARSGARLIQLGDQASLHTANIYGTGSDAFEQSSDMLRIAQHLLAQCGMGFHDVVRTWIQLRDIDRDYDALNTARRQFFEDCRLELRPASTGVQGIPFPTGHVCSLSLQAVKSPQSVDVAPMSTPSLNEAWSYGADFSRGLRVVESNKVTLHISGTASIDEAGRTVHVGDFDAQAQRMLDNVESLLERQGATFGSLISGVTYLKRPSDIAALRALYRRRGFEGFPCPIVEAPLCRPELLCETEALALLSLGSTET